MIEVQQHHQLQGPGDLLISSHRTVSLMLATSAPNNRLLLALCLSSFLGALNFLAITPFYPEMSNELDVSVSLLGQGITLMIFTSAFLGIAIGPIADRYGYRRPLIIGVGSVAAYLCGAGLAPSYPYLLGVSLFGSLGDALTFGVPLAIAGSLYTGAARKRAISWIIGALSCGGIIAVPLLTLAGSVSSWRIALISSGLVTVAITLFVARVVPGDHKASEGRWEFSLFRTAYAPVLRDNPTLRLLVSSAARAACWFGFLTYLGAFLSDELGLSTRQIGLVYTVGGAGYLIGSMAAERILGLSWLRELIALMCVVTALSTAGIAFVANLWIAVGLIAMLAMASSIAGIGVIYLLSNESPAESATTMLLNGSLLNLGGAGGAAAGGIALALGGYLAVGLTLSGFALLSSALVLLRLRPDRAGSDSLSASGAGLLAERSVAASADGFAQSADEM